MLAETFYCEHQRVDGDLIFKIRSDGEVILGAGVEVVGAARLLVDDLAELSPPPGFVHITEHLAFALWSIEGLVAHVVVSVTGARDPRGPGLVAWGPGIEGSAQARQFWAEVGRSIAAA